jgi:hypothetical protein
MKAHLGNLWRERADEILCLGKYRRSLMALKVTLWELQSLFVER